MTDASASDAPTHVGAALAWAWRHPAPRGAAGRCVGARTDLPVDPRQAKRLAHRIRAAARRARLPRVVATSPAQRCRAVGRWLRRFGFRHVVDARLAELDFGAWDGRRWHDIAAGEIAAWADDLLRATPHGGESVAALRARVAEVRARPPAPLAVTHGGWLSAALCTVPHGEPLDAAAWPAAPRYGQAVRLDGVTG